MPNKFPAFQVYPKEFISDRNVIVMSAEEVGAYWLLVCACWIEEDLPNDLEDLAATAKMPIDRFTASWNKRIARCFELDEKKNVFFHPRLRKEFRKQNGFRKQKSEAGKESARKRREDKKLAVQQALNDRSTGVERPYQQNPTFLIPNSGYNISTNVEISKEPQPPAEAAGLDDIWDSFRVLLQATGTSEKNARTKIGMLVKKHGKEKVAACWNEAQTRVAESVEPFAYFSKTLDGFVFEGETTKAIKAALWQHNAVYGHLDYAVDFKPERYGITPEDYARYRQSKSAG